MYNYKARRSMLFTEKGMNTFIRVRDKAMDALDKTGAFMAGHMAKGTDCYDTFELTACLDMLIERNEIREITSPSTAGQCRVFVKA